MASSSGSRLSRDEFKKQRELEEARKAGRAPAEVDEEGKEINPHIPQYIAQAPWYLSQSAPSLKHQRAFLVKNDFDRDWYHRGATVGTAATKFRKGACTNCGAMTHKAKECCERPRKVGARWNGKDIRPDEAVQELHLDFEGKRDRWNGYNPATFTQQLEQHEKLEQERRKMKKEEELNKFSTEPDPNQQRFPHNPDNPVDKPKDKLVDEESESESDLDSDFEDQEKQDFIDTEGKAVGVKKDPKTRTTIRNLRIREDTAKYLRNLDLTSAYYDPKSRSMRDNPTPYTKPDDLTYSGDNWVRQTGDANKFNDIQAYSYDAFERGQEIHIQASPSQAELLHKQFIQKKDTLAKKHQDEIAKRYGSQTPVEEPPAVVPEQTEQYLEYRADGSVAKGKADKVIPKGKYEEDIFINNHTTVWGSYWEDGHWGFACCRQTVKNSYCTGQAGISAKLQLKEELKQLRSQQEKKESEEDKRKTLKQDKVEKDDRKRSYNSASGQTYEVSEEEMESYMQKRKRFDDPMTYFDKVKV